MASLILPGPDGKRLYVCRVPREQYILLPYCPWRHLQKGAEVRNAIPYSFRFRWTHSERRISSEIEYKSVIFVMISAETRSSRIWIFL